MADNSGSNITPSSGGFNPTNRGVSPSGNVPIAVAGMAALTITPLPSNGVWASGIMYFNGSTAVDYQIVSNVPGTFSVLYYNQDGVALPFVPANVPYDPSVIKSFASAFNAKGYGFSFTYTNGPIAQTEFLIGIMLSNGVQPTQQSAVTGITDTNLALVTKSSIQGKENATGARKEFTGTANNSKFGIDVNVLNPPTSQAITGSVSVSNFPVTQPVSGTVTANVTFPATQPISGSVSILNPTPATDTTTLAKESGGNLASILTQLTAINQDQGSPTDAAATSVTGAQSEISLLKAMYTLLNNLQQRPATGTTVSNTTLATSTTVLAANPLRKGATMFSVTGTILILLGSGASATLFTSRLITNGYFEVPFGYTGIITAIGAGTLLVTELT